MIACTVSYETLNKLEKQQNSTIAFTYLALTNLNRITHKNPEYHCLISVNIIGVTVGKSFGLLIRRSISLIYIHAYLLMMYQVLTFSLKIYEHSLGKVLISKFEIQD